MPCECGETLARRQVPHLYPPARRAGDSPSPIPHDGYTRSVSRASFEHCDRRGVSLLLMCRPKSQDKNTFMCEDLAHIRRRATAPVLLPCSPRRTCLQVRFLQDLSPETCRLLQRLSKESPHHRVRQRAHCILWSFPGINTTALMAIFSVDRITLYNWFDAGETYHFVGLSDKQSCGRPPKLPADEQEKAQQYLEQHPRDVKKVVSLLEQATAQHVSTKTSKRLLKKTVMSGNASRKPPKKVLIHNNMSGAKRSYSPCRVQKLWV
jgi:transposase